MPRDKRQGNVWIPALAYLQEINTHEGSQIQSKICESHSVRLNSLGLLERKS